jgi:hypothetical protein
MTLELPSSISSKQMQSKVFPGLYYSKEPSLADFAPREEYCKNAPGSTSI